jgi:hypothetical protein
VPVRNSDRKFYLNFALVNFQGLNEASHASIVTDFDDNLFCMNFCKLHSFLFHFKDSHGICIYLVSCLANSDAMDVLQ